MMRQKYFKINYLFEASCLAGIADIYLLNQGQGSVFVCEDQWAANDFVALDRQRNSV